jgi:hypothetical protein
VPASAPSPGVPRYYVTAEPDPSNDLAVAATATGKTVYTISPPAGTFFGSVAATAGNRTFLAAATSNSSSCPAQTLLYQFQLNDQGQPGPLTPLNITIPGNFSETGDLAITPDGDTIAYATWLCDRTEVGVIDLASGHVGAWEATSFVSPASLSLSGDGSLLGYEMLSARVAEVLRTNAPSGSLSAHSEVVSRGAAWAALSQDGTTLYACSVPSSRSASAGSVTYYARSLAGNGQHVIASWNNLPSPQCWASLEPAGDYLLVQYPVAAKDASGWVQPAVLDIDTGQLTRIAAPSFYGPLDLAW